MTTTTGHSRPGRLRRGFTLVEVMVTTVLSGMLMAGAMASILTLSQGSNSLVNYVDMNNQSRHALELFGRDIRGATAVRSMSAHRVVVDTSGPNKTTLRVTYEYVPAAGALYRREGNGTPRIILNNIEQFEIRYYNLRQGVAGVPLEVKHIQIESLMRQSSLRADNTNHIISAQYMLRNKNVST